MTAISANWRAWGFPALLLLAVLISCVRVGYDRVAAPQTTLLIAECRLDIRLARDDLFSALVPGQGPVSLRVASAYAPPVAERPVAARLADMGVHPARQPIRGYILVEQDGRPADGDTGRAALLARDFAADADVLRQRYADRPGSAVMRGVIAARTVNGAVVPRLAAEQTILALPRDPRHALAALPSRPADAPCRNRFLAEVTVGAMGTPRLTGLRLLDGQGESDG